MNNYRYRKCGHRYSEIGHIAGYIILRHKGATPFLVSERELSVYYFDTMPNEPPIILERRKTVRAKRPVQQRKAKTKRTSGLPFKNSSFSFINGDYQDTMC